MTTRRYEPLLKIASGGTASVWVGASTGALGFRQLVAIKRPHEHLADDPAFVRALVEEAKLASRLRHANVVDVRDVETDERGVQLVMDWVEGASLSDLIRAWQQELPERPLAVAIRIVLDACEGLRALHELAGDDGEPLGCVHRDVSPANILVGLDGVGRLTDFGLARPLLLVERTTSDGALRGKLGYMAPEYIRSKSIDHRVDVFAMGVVLWEAIARRRLFRGEHDGETLERVQRQDAPLLAGIVPAAIGAPAAALDALLAGALAKNPDERIGTISELAGALEGIAREHDMLATHAEVREAFGSTLRAALEARRREVHAALAAASEPDAPVDTGTSPQTPDALRSAVGTGHSVALTNHAAGRSRKKSSAVWPALGVLAGVAVVSGTVAAAVVLRPDQALAHGAPRVVEPDVVPRIDETRARGPVATSSKTVVLRTAGAAGTSARAPARPSVPEDLGKSPRPNPYASATPSANH